MAREGSWGPDGGEAARLLDRSRQELDEALKEIRELARGIHPTVLSERGLGAAVEALAHRAPLPVEVGELPAQELPERVALAAYFVVSEALTNVAKHASATHASMPVASPHRPGASSRDSNERTPVLDRRHLGYTDGQGEAAKGRSPWEPHGPIAMRARRWRGHRSREP
jgi:hypothetical protein